MSKLEIIIDIIKLVFDVVIAICGFKITAILTRKQLEQQKMIDKPDCRVKASSVERGIQIRLENVGTGIMYITDIQYEIRNDAIRNNALLWQNTCLRGLQLQSSKECDCIKEKCLKEKRLVYLSALFTGKTVDTMTEAQIIGDHVNAQSDHHLLTVTFLTQKELEDAWEMIKQIKVTVEYNSSFSTVERADFYLEKDYITFKMASNGRKLKSFP